MPRKQQGWITFQSSEEERQLLEQYCQQSQRSKTEILRQMIRNLTPPDPVLAERSDQEEAFEDRLEGKSLKPGFALKTLKVSARNVLQGRVKQIILDMTSAEVTVEISAGVDLVATITRSSAEHLELSEGKDVYAVIKSSNIMIARD